MKRIVVLGSTGSIGTQVLEVVQRLAGRIQVVGLGANRNAEALADQAGRVGGRGLCLMDADSALRLHDLCLDASIRTGIQGMAELASLADADLVVVAVAGAIGIVPTHVAIEAGKDIALASKEVLVAAGEYTMRLARENGVRILPID